MIPAQQEEVFRVLDLVGQEQTDGLQGLAPSVHIVSQEQVIRLRGKSPTLKQPDEVKVLPMYIS